MKILLTGASGFVGSQLCGQLGNAGHHVRAVLREIHPLPRGAADRLWPGPIGPNTAWDSALADVDAVVHLAARVHVMNDAPANRDSYFAINAEGTRQLAQSAARTGVQRFVYLSTVKVNGDLTTKQPFRADDVPAPTDAYGESKWLAEQYLHGLVAQGLKPAIVRPPLIYGPGVRANFLRLMSWVEREIPLPLARVANLRSMVSLWNLCDLIREIVESDLPGANTFMVCDGEDISTPGLISRLAAAMNRRARLIDAPLGLLSVAASALGRRAEFARLCQSLRVDQSETHRTLGWQPQIPVDEGLRRTVDWFLAERAREVVR